MIYTSYFAKLKDLPNHIIPFSICWKAPDWYKGLQYKILAPKYDFFIEWKRNQDNEYYIKCFYERVLNKLNPSDVAKELYSISHGHDIALICYERPENFCHRHIVAEWLQTNGILCEEYSFNHGGKVK